MSLCFVSVAAFFGFGADWPQWRGPDLNLISVDADFQTDWPEDGPPIRWKTKVGVGYSSVSVVGERVWTMGHADDKETVYCLSTKNGEVIWTHRYAGKLVDNLHKGGPGSTPTVDGDRVYSLGKEGQFFCLDKSDGQVVWKFNAGEALGVKTPEWGFTGSPLIVGDRLILDLGRIVALNKNDGEILWKSGLAKAGYGSATPLMFAGQKAIAVLNNEGLVVLDVNRGEELAFHKWKTNFATNSTSPIVFGNSIFLSTGYQRGCTLLGVNDDTLQTVYEKKTLSNHMSNSVVHKGFIYGFDGNAHRGRNARLVCIEAATGAERWAQKGLGCGSLMMAGDKLLVLSEKGELVIAKANPEKWEELARAQVINERCWTVPVLANGQVYCRNDAGELVCVDVNVAR